MPCNPERSLGSPAKRLVVKAICFDAVQGAIDNNRGKLYEDKISQIKNLIKTKNRGIINIER